MIPERRVTSASTVGLPRESRISLALILMISVISASFMVGHDAYCTRKDGKDAADHARRLMAIPVQQTEVIFKVIVGGAGESFLISGHDLG